MPYECHYMPYRGLNIRIPIIIVVYLISGLRSWGEWLLGSGSWGGRP